MSDYRKQNETRYLIECRKNGIIEQQLWRTTLEDAYIVAAQFRSFGYSVEILEAIPTGYRKIC